MQANNSEWFRITGETLFPKLKVVKELGRRALNWFERHPIPESGYSSDHSEPPLEQQIHQAFEEVRAYEAIREDEVEVLPPRHHMTVYGLDSVYDLDDFYDGKLEGLLPDEPQS